MNDKPSRPETTTPYEDGDGTEVARLARERADNLSERLRAHAYADYAPFGGGLFTKRGGLEMDAAAEIDRLRARVAELERKLTNRNAKL